MTFSVTKKQYEKMLNQFVVPQQLKRIFLEIRTFIEHEISHQQPLSTIYRQKTLIDGMVIYLSFP